MLFVATAGSKSLNLEAFVFIVVKKVHHLKAKVLIDSVAKIKLHLYVLFFLQKAYFIFKMSLKIVVSFKIF